MEKIKLSANQLKKIDYTLLDHQATDEQLAHICRQALTYQVASVCVMPEHVAFVASQLGNSRVKTCTVISFPAGTNSLEEKLREAQEVLANGAEELDLVINYHLIDVEPTSILNELIAVHSLIKNTNSQAILKVIVESGLLTEVQTKIVTEICIQAGVEFIKTSTGKVAIGAELSKVSIMKATITAAQSNLKIKASGGIRTIEQINELDSLVDRFGMGYASVDQLVVY